VRAAGGDVRMLVDGAYRPFDCFELPEPRGASLADLRYWDGALILGDPEAVQLYADAEAARAPGARAEDRGSARAGH
jgi:hypothetical protein